MACRLVSTKPLSDAGLLSIGHLGINFSEIFNQNTQLFIHENAYENIVCEMAAIFCMGDELTRIAIFGREWGKSRVT